MLKSIEHKFVNIKSFSDNGFLKILFIFTLFIALLIYSYEITNFSLSIDEEHRSYSSGDWRIWVSQGRWGMAALSYTLPTGFDIIPFLPTLLFVIGLSLSSVIFATIFSGSREAAIVFSGVFISSPVWLHLAEFNTLSWGFSLGLFLVAIATKYMNAAGSKNYALTGVYAGLSLAIYQPLFLLYIAALLLIAFRENWGRKATQKSNFFSYIYILFADAFKSLTVALVFYFSVNYIAMNFSGLKLEYLNNYVHLHEYLNGNFSTAIARVINQTKGLLFGTDPAFLSVGAISLLLFWIGSLLGFKRFFDSDIKIVTKMYAVTILIGILFLAMFLIIISAGYIPTRSLIIFPFLYATLSAASFNFKKGIKLFWIIFGAILFVNTYIGNALFYSDHIARQRDLAMATRLINSIEDVSSGVFEEKIPFTIVGEWHHEIGGPAIRVEIFGESFFGHDGGNPYRISSYLRLLGCRRLVPLPVTEIKNELNEIRLRPSWPEKGSVFISNHVLVVKLSDLSYQQKLLLRNK
jgi:hypothetical protein